MLYMFRAGSYEYTELCEGRLKADPQTISILWWLESTIFFSWWYAHISGRWKENVCGLRRNLRRNLTVYCPAETGPQLRPLSSGGEACLEMRWTWWKTYLRRIGFPARSFSAFNLVRTTSEIVKEHMLKRFYAMDRSYFCLFWTCISFY